MLTTDQPQTRNRKPSPQAIAEARTLIGPYLTLITRGQRIDWSNVREVLLTAEQFAACLGPDVPTTRAYELGAQRRIAVVRPDERKVRYLLSDAIKLLQAGYQPALADNPL